MCVVGRRPSCHRSVVQSLTLGSRCSSQGLENIPHTHRQSYPSWSPSFPFGSVPGLPPSLLNMIDPRSRLWAGSGNLLNGGPYTWHVTDFDQRRTFAVTYAPPTPVEDTETTEDICINKLRKHVNQLGDGVFGIRFSEPDGPFTLLTERKHDRTYAVNNYPLSALKLNFPVKTICLSNLTELDRLGHQVDLVSYQESPSITGIAPQVTKAAFKYCSSRMGCFGNGMNSTVGVDFLVTTRISFHLTRLS